MFLYMQDNVLRRSGKCCATVRGMFLCGENFVDEAGEKLLFWKKNLGKQFLLHVPPESQMKNFSFLLEAANVNDENKIVMTTHSPYVLSYITLAAKAYELMNKGVKCNLARKNKTNGNRNAAK